MGRASLLAHLVCDEAEIQAGRIVSAEPAASSVRPTRVKVPLLLVLVVLAAGAPACGTQAGGPPAQPPAAASGTAIPARTATISPQGSGTASLQATTPPPASPGAATGPNTLTAADNGAAVPLHPGQRVTVTLAGVGMFSWHIPAAAGAAVTKISTSGGYPGPRPARAVFLAVRFGKATLSAIDDTACLHAHPACLPSQQAWQVTVIVTPAIRPPERGPATPAP